MKTTSPRAKQILNLLTQKGELTVAEIQQTLQISQATAYREIESLVQAGQACKVRGGLVQKEPSVELCQHCLRPASPRLRFHIEDENAARQIACCAHCGFLIINQTQSIRQATTPDFLYGTLLNAAQAWYVLGSSIAPCCQPSVLAFQTPTDAERFAAGFGGQVCDFHTARTQISHLMRIHPQQPEHGV